MKNAIKYYYNLEPDNIHLINNNYFFSINDNHYVLYLCEKTQSEIEKIYELQINLYERNIYVHRIIPNNYQTINTQINEKKYILMLMYNEMNKKVDKRYIIDFNEKTSYILNRENNDVDWKKKWEEKIDYFEYQINQIGIKFKKIRSSFSYFIGMGELAISMLNSIPYNPTISISHRRINEDSTLFELYNPFTLIIDYKIRDMCEFFKYNFIKKKDVFEDIKKYLITSNLSTADVYVFFVRMIFPTFYFDYYEQIVANYFNENVVNESVIDNIENIANDYENLLKKIYQYLKKYMIIPKIEWFENN